MDDEIHYVQTTNPATGKPAIGVLLYGNMLIDNELLDHANDDRLMSALNNELDSLMRALRDVALREFLAARSALRGK